MFIRINATILRGDIFPGQRKQIEHHLINTAQISGIELGKLILRMTNGDRYFLFEGGNDALFAWIKSLAA